MAFIVIILLNFNIQAKAFKIETATSFAYEYIFLYNLWKKCLEESFTIWKSTDNNKTISFLEYFFIKFQNNRYYF